METNKIYCGNSLDILKTFEDSSIDCCITSPPYYGLRDYGTGKWLGGDPNCPHKRLNKVGKHTSTGHAQEELAGNVGDSIYKSVCPLCGAVRVDDQVGLEETPEEYINKLVEIFREVKRVLKEDGTLWVNIGDSYASTNSNNRNFIDEGGRGGNNPNITTRTLPNDIKPKDLIGIPWMLAFALRADGWYLRQDIIWHKTNPMPESVKDRCTKSHEYIFLLSKSPRYYFDYEAIREVASEQHITNSIKFGGEKYGDDIDTPRIYSGSEYVPKSDFNGVLIRQKRDVWDIPTSSFKEAHFATFPKELVRNCLLSGCPIGGVVIDPFMGSGTVGVVAKENHRKYVGIDLNPKYVELANDRISGMLEFKNAHEVCDNQIKTQSLW